MWNTIETLAITLAVSMLKAMTKSANITARESKIISQVALAATQADSIANGTVWSSTTATQ